jgi:hypothetical protein
MTIKVMKVKDLVELHNYDLEQIHDTKKIYKLLRVIDINGNSIPSTDEIEVVIESVEIES